MKAFKAAAAAIILIAGTASVQAEGSVGEAGILMDFNRDGKTDSSDWDQMRDWVANYRMKEGEETCYGNQEVPASINLLIDKDYAGAAKTADAVDLSGVTSYYLPSIGDTTPIKDQNPFGTCWAFGTIAALESNLLHKRHGNSGVINPDAFELKMDNVSKDLDLSELYHAYMNQEAVEDGSQKGEGSRPIKPNEKNANLLMGGFESSSQVLLTSWTGPLAESQEPYAPLSSANGSQDTYGLRDAENDRTSPVLAHVQEFVYIGSPSQYHIDTDRKRYIFDRTDREAIDRIKQAMIKYGALMISYNADQSMPGDGRNSDYMNYEHFCQFDDSIELSMNHMVTMVGWDDSYPRENFQTGKGKLPEHNGAFLIKNSWGNYDTSLEKYGNKFTEAYNVFSGSPEGQLLMSAFNYGIPDANGHGSGYAWVSYEDHSILNITAIDADDAMDGFQYDHIYQYDYAKPVSFVPISLPTDNSETLVANIFTSERDETLAAVSVYAPENNASAEIEVYRITDDNMQDPTGGELIAFTAADFACRGFYTVDLPEPAELKKGDRFAVVENIQTEKDGKKVSWLNLEQTIRSDLQTVDNINEGHSSVVANSGETLVYVNNGTKSVWADVKELDNTQAAKVLGFGNAYIKAYTITSEKEPLPSADPTYQGVQPGSSKEIDMILIMANLPKYIMWGGIALVVIIALIIFLIVRAVRKKKKAKAAE